MRHLLSLTLLATSLLGAGALPFSSANAASYNPPVVAAPPYGYPAPPFGYPARRQVLPPPNSAPYVTKYGAIIPAEPECGNYVCGDCPNTDCVAHNDD